MSGITGAKAGEPGYVPAGVNSTPTNSPSSSRSSVGIAGAANSIGSWGPVKKVRASTVWSWISAPFSFVGSILSGIWARISNKIWGKPIVIADSVVVKVPGWLWGHTEQPMATERALRKGLYTIDAGVVDTKFTREQAAVKGWQKVTVNVPGRWYGFTPTELLLKHAIERGFMTVEKAITDGHITKDQAEQADWIAKK